MQSQPDATFEVQLATARVEAVMAKAASTMALFLDGPDSLNSHVAKAVKTILDDHMLPLQNRMEELSSAVEDHYPDPTTRPDPPDSHAMFADRVAGLTDRYDSHMNRHHLDQQKYSASSVFYSMTITAVVTNAAIRALSGEVMSRDAHDPTARAYRTALLETAAEIPHRAQIIKNVSDDNEANNDRMRRHLRLAQEAEADTLRLVELHSAAGE